MSADSGPTNPVVIRRCLGDLRGAGPVESRRGAGAGGSLVRELASTAIADVLRHTHWFSGRGRRVPATAAAGRRSPR